MDNSMDILKDIEAKRADLAEKISKIEEKKSIVSAEVYEKVKKEYEKKMKEIEAQLFENIEMVKAEGAKIIKQLDELSREEKDLRLLLEEIELRYTIGEYDDDTYNTQNGEAKERLKKVTVQLKKLEERRHWLESFGEIKAIEESVRPVEEVMTPVEEVVTPVEEIMAPVEEDKPPIPKKPDEPAPPKDDGGIRIDEHVLEEKLPGQEQRIDELLVEDLALTEISEAKLTAVPEEKPAAKKEEKAVPCPKCGHQNAPDSWYCEKCGAEILDISRQ